MERKKWRGGGGRRDGLCLLLVVCRCASPEISAQPDNHDWPANPLPTYVPLAVICSNSNQPPALHPARIRSCLAHFFQKQHESCAGLARDKDTDALTPARSVTSYQNQKFACLRIFQPRRLPRGAHRTIVPSNTHSPTEILGSPACRFTGPWMRGFSCECWGLLMARPARIFDDDGLLSSSFPTKNDQNGPTKFRACPREGGLGRGPKGGQIPAL